MSGGEIIYKLTIIIAVATISVSSALALPGSGTQEDPYRIESLADFNDFATDANYWDDYTRLETDINLAGRTYTNAVIARDTDPAKARFQGTAFTGILDGNGHKMMNLTIDDGGTDNDYLGLFGYIDGGQIRNLALEDISISGGEWSMYVGALAGTLDDAIVRDCYSTGEVRGGKKIGGLVGYNEGVVADCYSDANVYGAHGTSGGLVATNDGEILNCHATGCVVGVEPVGGLTGGNGLSVSRCYATGDVSGRDRVGGLVGGNGHCISDSYSTGDVRGAERVGGLAGYTTRTISNCYSIGDVNGTEDVGGLVGCNEGNVLNCLWDIETQTHGVTESIGYGSGTVANVVGLSTSQMQTQTTFTSVGWDFRGESANGTSETWRMPSGVGYPVLNDDMPMDLAGSGTVTDPYLIGDVNELGMLKWYAADCSFKLAKDIDMSGIVWSIPLIPVFAGRLDGNAHKLSNLEMSGGDWLGLFGQLDSRGQIMGLGLENVSLTGSDYVGSLVGCNLGRISSCYSTGSISGQDTVGGLVGENDEGSISDCHSSSDVEGSTYIGGIVGVNRGSISKCYSSGEVRAGGAGGGIGGYNYGSLSNCYSTSDVAGGGGNGGLLGRNRGVVGDCYATGEVAGGNYVGGLVGSNYQGSVSNNYSTVDVNAIGNRVGGLVGQNDGGVWSDCFWDAETQTHGVAVSVGENDGGTVINLAGLSTTDMQKRSTFISAGWDFMGESVNGMSETWQMPQGGGYPALSFFHSEIPFPLSGSGTISDPYLIGDANELGMVNWYPEESCFTLTTDIDLSGIDWSVAVVPVFSGCLDGGGHKLTNMKIAGGGWLGLFGYVGEHGAISELGVKDSSVSGNGRYVGGLVGKSRGNISDCYYTGEVGGRSYVGGLAGCSEGSVSKCYAVADVNATGDSVGGLMGYNNGSVTSCYSSGYVTGDSEIGGLVGNDLWDSDISDCYATCDVIGTGGRIGGLMGSLEGSAANCYSAGSVRGRLKVGGLVGRAFFLSTLSNCFWDTDIRSCRDLASIGDKDEGATVSGVVGLHTVDMQRKSTFTSKGWDFIRIWDLTCEGMDYPRFPCQILPTDFLCPHGVDFRDYSFFANHWMDTNCGDVNDCDGTDLDLSGAVGPSDLRMIAESWLQQKRRAFGCPPGLFEPATCPDPAHGAVRVGTDLVLSWHPGCGALSHDVYFGTASPGTFQVNQTEVTFSPDPLSKSTKYYWRIDEVNANGKTRGSVWYFTTTSGGVR